MPYSMKEYVWVSGTTEAIPYLCVEGDISTQASAEDVWTCLSQALVGAVSWDARHREFVIPGTSFFRFVFVRQDKRFALVTPSQLPWKGDLLTTLRVMRSDADLAMRTVLDALKASDPDCKLVTDGVKFQTSLRMES
jgi:hypothetical protein